MVTSKQRAEHKAKRQAQGKEYREQQRARAKKWAQGKKVDFLRAQARKDLEAAAITVSDFLDRKTIKLEDLAELKGAEDLIRGARKGLKTFAVLLKEAQA